MLIVPLVASAAVFVVDPSEDAGGKETVTVVYEAGYASGVAGTADTIRYAAPGGHAVEVVGEPLPWQSPPLEFDPEDELLLVVEAPPQEGTPLTCSAHTDQGPYGREASFSTPDPVCRVETTLEALERD